MTESDAPNFADLMTGEYAGSEPAIALPAAPEMLTTHDPDKCCAKALEAFLGTVAAKTATSWQCPRCGQEWTGEIVGAAVKHWRVRPMFLLLRDGRSRIVRP